MSDPVLSAPKAVATDADFGLTRFITWAKAHATPYHLAVAGVLGGITAVFAVVIVLLLICALNLNVLGLIE
jgi:hypothetical protein